MKTDIFLEKKEATSQKSDFNSDGNIKWTPNGLFHHPFKRGLNTGFKRGATF
ncbi:hypothetical protein N0M98_00090 [Paenibacillus doosanensis]|nr:hypothetical protein [Paenibacillus doosanensis]